VFIPFIENAFKYASSFKTGNAIQIEFIEEQQTLRFICKNRIAAKSGDLISSNGLGNQLLKKRLDLIYKETYILNIQEENEYFCVDLTIPYEAN
jgi:sensor histidine kinase YesM